MGVKLTVLKLGGSVITHKEKPFTPNRAAIKRLAKEIASAKLDNLILVHGGGSFGHPLAKRYRIKEGFNGKASQLLGFAETHEAMVTLNKLVIDALIKEKIPAVAVSPSSFLMTKSERIQNPPEEPLTKLLSMRFVPVLFGDAVLDLDKGFTILSGDQLIAQLAIKFEAERIIVGVDVDGLFTDDPKTNKEAELLSLVTLKGLEAVLRQIEVTKANDVTGGMPSKIREMIPALGKGVNVLIVNAAKSGNLQKALIGEKVGGTVISRL